MKCYECVHCSLVYQDEEQAEGCCGPHFHEISADKYGPCPDCFEIWFQPDFPGCLTCVNTQVIMLSDPVDCSKCSGTGRIEEEHVSWDCDECEGWGHKQREAKHDATS